MYILPSYNYIKKNLNRLSTIVKVEIRILLPLARLSKDTFIRSIIPARKVLSSTVNGKILVGHPTARDPH